MITAAPKLAPICDLFFPLGALANLTLFYEGRMRIALIEML